MFSTADVIDALACLVGVLFLLVLAAVLS